MCGSFIANCAEKVRGQSFCRVWWNIKGRFVGSDYLMCVISGSTSLTLLSCSSFVSQYIYRGFPYVRLDLENENENENEEIEGSENWDDTIVNWWFFMCLTFLLTGCFSLLFYFLSSSSSSLSSSLSSCDIIRSLIISQTLMMLSTVYGDAKVITFPKLQFIRSGLALTIHVKPLLSPWHLISHLTWQH